MQPKEIIEGLIYISFTTFSVPVSDRGHRTMWDSREILRPLVDYRFESILVKKSYLDITASIGYIHVPWHGSIINFKLCDTMA